MFDAGDHEDVLHRKELEAWRHIIVREEKLCKLALLCELFDPSNVKMVDAMQTELANMRENTIDTVHAIMDWNTWVAQSTDTSSNGIFGSSLQCPFLWKGKNYLAKILRDTDFVWKSDEFCESFSLPTKKNPLFLSYSLDESPRINAEEIMSNQSSRARNRALLTCHILHVEDVRLGIKLDSNRFYQDGSSQDGLLESLNTASLRALAVAATPPNASIIALFGALSVICSPPDGSFQTFCKHASWSSSCHLLDNPVSFLKILHNFDVAVYLSNTKLRALQSVQATSTTSINPDSLLAVSDTAFTLFLWVRNILNEADMASKTKMIVKATSGLPMGSNSTRQELDARKSDFCLCTVNDDHLRFLSHKGVFFRLGGRKDSSEWFLFTAVWTQSTGRVAIRAYNVAREMKLEFEVRTIQLSSQHICRNIESKNIRSFIQDAIQNASFFVGEERPSMSIEPQTICELRTTMTLDDGRQFGVNVYRYRFSDALLFTATPSTTEEPVHDDKTWRIELTFDEIGILLLHLDADKLASLGTTGICKWLASRLQFSNRGVEMDRILLVQHRVIKNGGSIQVSVAQQKEYIVICTQKVLNPGVRIRKLALSRYEANVLVKSSPDSRASYLEKLLKRFQIDMQGRDIVPKLDRLVYAATTNIDSYVLHVRIFAERTCCFRIEASHATSSPFECILTLEDVAALLKQGGFSAVEIQTLIFNEIQLLLRTMPQFLCICTGHKGEAVIRTKLDRTTSMVTLVSETSTRQRTTIGSIDVGHGITLRHFRRAIEESHDEMTVPKLYQFVHRGVPCGRRQESRRMLKAKSVVLKRCFREPKKPKERITKPHVKVKFKSNKSTSVTSKTIALDKMPLEDIEAEKNQLVPRNEDPIESLPEPEETAIIPDVLTSTVKVVAPDPDTSNRITIEITCDDLIETFCFHEDCNIASIIPRLEEKFGRGLKLYKSMSNEELDLNTSFRDQLDGSFLKIVGRSGQRSPSTIRVRLDTYLHVVKGQTVAEVYTFGRRTELPREHWNLSPGSTIEIRGKQYTIEDLPSRSMVELTSIYEGETEHFVPVTKIVSDNPDPRLEWERYPPPCDESQDEVCSKSVRHFGISMDLKKVKDIVFKSSGKVACISNVEDEFRRFKVKDILLAHFTDVCSWYPESSCIDGAKFTKYCRTFGLLQDSELDQTSIDIAFTKARNAETRKLGLTEFVDAVRFVTTSAYPDILETHRLYEYCFVVASLPECVRNKLWQTAKSRAFIQEGTRQCAVICIQAFFRGFLVRKFWRWKARSACIQLQSYWRAYLARELVGAMKKSRDQQVEEQRRAKCACQIQRSYRAFQKRKQFSAGSALSKMGQRIFRKARRDSQIRHRIRQGVGCSHAAATIKNVSLIVSVSYSHDKDKTKRGLLVSVYDPKTSKSHVFILSSSHAQRLLGSSDVLIGKDTADTILKQISVSKRGPDLEMLLRLRQKKVDGLRVVRCVKKNEMGLCVVDAYFSYTSGFCIQVYDPRGSDLFSRSDSIAQLENVIPGVNALETFSNPSSQRQTANYILNNIAVSKGKLITIEERAAEKREEMCILIQCAWRCYISWKIAHEKCIRTYIVANIEGFATYVNVKTGSYSYNKPRFLGIHDLTEYDESWHFINDRATDTCYYINPLSGKTSKFNDVLAASMIQRNFRATRQRFSFLSSIRAMIEAIHFQKNIPIEYHKDPESWILSLRYVVYLHVVDNANKEASRIVETMMKQHQDGDSGLFLRRMNRILILASSEQENNRNQARHEMTMESLEYEDEWDLIEKCLFEFSVIQSPSSPHAYRNLAILNHYHKRDTRRAEMLYQTALLLNESQGIAEDTVTLCYNDLLAEIANTSEYVDTVGAWKQYKGSAIPKAHLQFSCSAFDTFWYHNSTGKASWKRPSRISRLGSQVARKKIYKFCRRYLSRYSRLTFFSRTLDRREQISESELSNLTVENVIMWSLYTACIEKRCSDASLTLSDRLKLPFKLPGDQILVLRAKTLVDSLETLSPSQEFDVNELSLTQHQIDSLLMIENEVFRIALARNPCDQSILVAFALFKRILCISRFDSQCLFRRAYDANPSNKVVQELYNASCKYIEPVRRRRKVKDAVKACGDLIEHQSVDEQSELHPPDDTDEGSMDEQVVKSVVKIQRVFRRWLFPTIGQFPLLSKAIQLDRFAHQHYILHPERTASILNFALVQQFYQFEFSAANHLYKRVIKADSTARQEPLFNYGYGLLLLNANPLQIKSRRKGEDCLRLVDDPLYEKRHIFEQLFIKYPLIQRPRDARVHWAAALFYHFVVGSVDDARAHYANALHLNPKNPGCQLNIAKLDRDWLVRRSISSAIKFSDGLYNLKYAALKIQKFYRCRLKFPCLSLPFREIVEVLKLKRYAKSRFSQANATLASIINYALSLHILEENPIQSIPVYRKALQTSDTHIISHCGVAIALLMTSTPSQAFAHMWQVKQLLELPKNRELLQTIEKRCMIGPLILNPQSAFAYCTYALFQQIVYEDFDRAEILYKMAIEAEPDSTLVQQLWSNFNQNRRSCCIFEGYGPMREHALASQILSHSYPEVVLNIGSSFNLETGQCRWTETADDDYRSQLEKGTAASRIQHWYRECYSKRYVTPTGMDSLALSIRFCRFAAMQYEKYPNQFAKVVNFALFQHFIEHNHSAASRAYIRALELSPDSVLALQGHALLLKLNGSSREADTLLQKANEIDARDEEKNINDIEETFFRFSLAQSPTCTSSLLNYALLKHYIQEDVIAAEYFYRKAKSHDVTSQSQLAYEAFLSQRWPSQRLPGTGPALGALENKKEIYKVGNWIKYKIARGPQKDANTTTYQTFWLNIHSRRTLWTRPAELASQFFMTEDSAASKIQHVWLKWLDPLSFSRIPISALESCLRYEAFSKDLYIQDPGSLAKQVNFAIYLHAFEHDYRRAAELYTNALTKTPQNPLLLRCMGLLLLAESTEGSSSTKALEMLKSAETIDPTGSSFRNAEQRFFQWSTIRNPFCVHNAVNMILICYYVHRHYTVANLVRDPNVSEMLRTGLPSNSFDVLGPRREFISCSVVVYEKLNWQRMRYVSPNGEQKSFWFDTLTTLAYWDLPTKGASIISQTPVVFLSHNDIARLLQRIIRKKICFSPTISLKVAILSMKLDTFSSGEFEKGKSLSRCINFGLKLHVFDHKFSEASRIYSCARRLNDRHPTLLRSYAILMVISSGRLHGSDSEAMLGMSASVDPSCALYTMAYENFYLWAVIKQPGTLAYFMLGLVELLVYKKYDHAQSLFQRALKADGGDKDTRDRLERIYSEFLQNRLKSGKYPGGGPGETTRKRSIATTKVGNWVQYSDPEQKKSKLRQFWYNEMTCRTNWSPEPLSQYATRIQRVIRKTICFSPRTTLTRAVLSVKLERFSKMQFEKHPDSLNSCINYGLKSHIFDHDYREAGRIYMTAMKLDNQNPTLLRSYAILLIVTSGHLHFPESEEMLRTATSSDPSGRTYDLAYESFYQWAAIRQFNSAKELFMLGLVELVVYRRFNHAQSLFLRALAFDEPPNYLKLIYNEFLENRLDSGGGGPGEAARRRSKLTERKIGPWSQYIDPKQKNCKLRLFWYNELTCQTSWTLKDNF